MTSKVETYSIPLNLVKDPEVRMLVVTLNSILARLEDRLDEMEALRGTQYSTTARWEKNEVGE